MRIINLSLLLLCVSALAAERPLWDISAKIGLNLGGAMPFPIPANIQKIENYSSNIGPTVEAEALRWINKKVGVSAGIRSDNKGAKTTTKVKEYSLRFEDFHGKFRGTVDTEMSFNYLSLPVLAHYVLQNNFSVYAGAYYAYLLNGEFKGAASAGYLNTGTDKITFREEDREQYDFSKELRRYDAGLSIGMNYLPYNEHILLSFDFNYGLLSVFPEDFKGIADDMQNVYGRLSVGYLF
ncbi:MAG: PorT family protein [Fibromonadales bacterium]|nr:PorT family protein [Fibromonadales bacterium]